MNARPDPAGARRLAAGSTAATRAVAVDAPARGRARERPAPRACAGGLRLAAFAALVLYGCQHWVRQVAPTEAAVAVQMAAVAAALALGLAALGRAGDGRLRRLAVAGLCVLAGVAALTAAGIPLRFAGWRNWGELSAGVREGVTTLPNLNIPYRGLDEWVRWIVPAGGALLAVLAAGLAYAPASVGRAVGPRRIHAAALVLCLLYAIPVVERNPESPMLSGVGFALLLALFLGAPRLAVLQGASRRLIVVAAGVGALCLAALLAPALDGARPWLNYRALAGDLAERNQTSFNWNHSYTPLDWPRDGRELLRVRAKEASYWKATVLRRFDGLRWVTRPDVGDSSQLDTPQSVEPKWYEDIEVTVRALRSEQYLAAGYTQEIAGTPRPPIPAGSGTFRTAGRPLRPGDTYTASVYTPRPTQKQLGEAGTRYPNSVRFDRTMELPARVGGPRTGREGLAPIAPGSDAVTVLFPAFGSDVPLQTFFPGRGPVQGGDELLARSAYRRTWAVAQELRAAATSPLDLVRRVRERVQTDTRYSEVPPVRPVPLEAFLFEDKAGYCQQFSGAMALMLRMAGLPARVASGFTPGSFDSDRGQYIVRDLDAHSWVEAYFPEIGWVTFDPTPTAAPPSSQDTGDGGDVAGESEAGGPSARGDVPVPPSSSPAVPDAGGAQAGPGPSSGLIAVTVLLALALAGLGTWRWRRPSTALAPTDELRRALRRSGRPVAPGLTLHGLEQSLRGAPTAQAYVRKLRLARYAERPEVPTPTERAALRHELAAGLGLRGRLRSWWALPPRLERR